STRVALDHLESVPEKLSLLEGFKDFRNSHSLCERTDGRYPKFRIHRDPFQRRQEDTKYRMKTLKDDRSFVEDSHAHGLVHSSSWQDYNRFLSSPRFSHLSPLTRRTVAPDSASVKEDAASLPMNGTSSQSKKEDYENKKGK
ncbi:Hypothetical predicted protein, partial [Marmota monax]